MGKYVSDIPSFSGIKDASGVEYLPVGNPRLGRQGVLRNNTVAGSSYDSGIFCMICDSNYIYAISSWDRRYVRKYDINTLEMVAEIFTGTIWTTAITLTGLEQDDTYIYVGASYSGKTFAKLLKSNLSVVAKYTTGSIANNKLRMFKGFLFAATADANSISKFNPSTMTLVATISGTQYAIDIVVDDSFLYFTASSNNTSPYTLYKYNESLVLQSAVQVYSSSPIAAKNGRFLSAHGDGYLEQGVVNSSKFNYGNSQSQLSLRTPLGTGAVGRVYRLVQLDGDIFIALVNGSSSNSFYKGIFLIDIAAGIQIPMWDFHELFSDSSSFDLSDIVVTPDKKYAILAIFDTISTSYFMHTLIKFPIEYALDRYYKKA